MENLKKYELPTPKDFKKQVDDYYKKADDYFKIENLNEKKSEDGGLDTPDNLKKDCDCATKKKIVESDFWKFKSYVLTFLRELMNHEILKFQQLNNFFINVDRVDRFKQDQEENEIGNGPNNNST